MLQALLHLLSTQPQLVAGHAQAYGELAVAEAAVLAAQWRRRLSLLLLALCLGVLALGLAGTALLLWAVTPAAQIHTPWLLWAVPLLPAAAAAACAWAAREPEGSAVRGPFQDLREQVQADWQLLREAGQADGAP